MADNKKYCRKCEYAQTIGGMAYSCGCMIREPIFSVYNDECVYKGEQCDIKENINGDCQYYKKASLWTLFWRS